MKRLGQVGVGLALMTIGWGGAISMAHGFGEPRVVPNSPFYFTNERFDNFPYATVVRVLDGATVIVQIDGDDRLRPVRLAGIRSLGPEVPPVLNDQALATLAAAIQYRRVKLEGDTFLRQPDGTGPVEVYIWLEGRQINEEMVSQGLAVVRPYTHNLRRDNYLRGVQGEAMAAGRGVWSTGLTPAEIEFSTETELFETRP